MCVRKRGVLIFTVLVLIFSAAGCGEQGRNGTEQLEERESGTVTGVNSAAYMEEIEKYCGEYYDIFGAAGLCVGIYDNGDTSFFSYGKTDWGSDNITENTQFEIASITKIFMGVLMAEMARDPKLDFNYTDPVENYVDFRIPEKDGVKPEFWHLATHTSGMPRMPNNANQENPYLDYDLEKMRDYFETAELETVPGEKYAYSNLANGVLGVALTGVAGIDYANADGLEHLIQDRILDPIGMTQTCMGMNEEQYAALAKPHQAGGGRATIWEWYDSSLAGAGAMLSNATDLVKYVAACVGDAEIPETLAQGIDDSCQIYFADRVNNMGFGFSVDSLPNGSTYCWKDGGSSGTNSLLGFCRETKTGVVVLCNTKGSVNNLGEAILQAMQP